MDSAELKLEVGAPADTSIWYSITKSTHARMNCSLLRRVASLVQRVPWYSRTLEQLLSLITQVYVACLNSDG